MFEVGQTLLFPMEFQQIGTIVFRLPLGVALCIRSIQVNPNDNYLNELNTYLTFYSPHLIVNRSYRFILVSFGTTKTHRILPTFLFIHNSYYYNLLFNALYGIKVVVTTTELHDWSKEGF